VLDPPILEPIIFKPPPTPSTAKRPHRIDGRATSSGVTSNATRSKTPSSLHGDTFEARKAARLRLSLTANGRLQSLVDSFAILVL
jgi:hypothetical protein